MLSSTISPPRQHRQRRPARRGCVEAPAVQVAPERVERLGRGDERFDLLDLRGLEQNGRKARVVALGVRRDPVERILLHHLI